VREEGQKTFQRALRQLSFVASAAGERTHLCWTRDARGVRAGEQGLADWGGAVWSMAARPSRNDDVTFR